MNFSAMRSYILKMPGSVEEFPFDTVTLVVKVGGKMFALIAKNDDPLRMNLKCDPEKAEVLRELYPAILPGYHMNKRHWNTIVLDGSISEEIIQSMIDDSYALVVQGLPRSKRP